MKPRTFKESVQGTTDVLTGVGVLCAASDALNMLPLGGFLIGFIDLFKDCSQHYDAAYAARITEGPTRKPSLAALFLKSVSNSSLIISACQALPHAITVGSTALGGMCYGFAFKSMVDFGFAVHEYVQFVKTNYRSDERDAALRKMCLSLLRMTGWLLLSAAHMAATSSAGPVLLIVGSAFLLAAGAYGIYHLYKNYKAGVGFFASLSSIPTAAEAHENNHGAAANNDLFVGKGFTLGSVGSAAS